MLVDLVNVKTRDGLRLDGTFREPSRKNAAQLGVDVIIRGHDPISRAIGDGGGKRSGAAYEVMDDCRYDWEAWIGFAQAAGYQRRWKSWRRNWTM